jgi:hypothetical protein
VPRLGSSRNRWLELRGVVQACRLASSSTRSPSGPLARAGEALAGRRVAAAYSARDRTVGAARRLAPEPSPQPLMPLLALVTSPFAAKPARHPSAVALRRFAELRESSMPSLLRLYKDPPGLPNALQPTPPPPNLLLAAGIEAGGLWPRALAGAPPPAPFFLLLVLVHLRPSQDHHRDQ